MEKLYQSISIKNHPISSLPDNIKQEYLKGVGAVLKKFAVDKTYAQLLFEVWCISILGKVVCYEYTEQCIKRALDLHRVGLKFFRLKYEFFFDCFYLLAMSGCSTCNVMYNYLKNNIVGIFTEKALNQVADFFIKDQQCNSIPKELVEHRKQNIIYTNKPIKRILVVANVSAGKSTLINALTGYRVNMARNLACTNALHFIYNKANKDVVTYLDLHRKDYWYNESIENITSDIFSDTAFHFNSDELGKVCFIDTPGVNNVMDRKHQQITLNAIKENNYEGLIFISNGKNNATTDDATLMKYIVKHCKKPIIWTLNQLDGFKQQEDSIKKMLNDYRKDICILGVKNPTIIPVSAKVALLMKQGDCLDEDDAYELDKYNKLFGKPYFDLPSYLNDHTIEQSTDLLDRTGIPLLEKTIMNNFNTTYL